MNRGPTSSDHEQHQTEDESIYFSPLILGLVALSLLVMMGLAMGHAALVALISPPARSPRPTAILPPEPRLQAAPRIEFQEMKATQMARLNNYSWIDEEAGIVRIPIERAMQLVAERGFMITTPGAPGVAGTPGPGETNEDTTEGQRLFQELGCGGCHTGAPDAAAPPLEGLFGEEVTLASGETVKADEGYLRESILDPDAKIVEGYQPIMPSFQGEVSEEQLAALIAYIKSLGN
ncbi:MAG TPA: cytochrome c, partial [Anaerolineales bacterium]